MFSGELHEKEIYLIVVSLHIAGNLHAHKSLLSGGFLVSELQKSMESSHLEWQAKNVFPPVNFLTKETSRRRWRIPIRHIT